MTLQMYTLDATQCRTIAELGEFCDVKYVDYSIPWPHGKRPSKLLISKEVANEITALHPDLTKNYKWPLRFRTIPCEIKE